MAVYPLKYETFSGLDFVDIIFRSAKEVWSDVKQVF